MKKILLLILLSVTLLSFPKVNFGQAPNLGTASSFAIFTSAGAITNTGATTINGNLGVFVGAYTGTPLPTVTGDTHLGDAIAEQAAADVCAAYNSLGTPACGVGDIVIATTLGNGQTLTPGTYCTGAATTINGNLILDAQGDANAVFIIQIDGALATTAGSTITLINGANLCNVYFQVSGAASLGANSVFRGTILGNGEINLAAEAILEGRALTCAGAINLNTNTVTNSCAAGAGQVLPVTLSSFTVQNNNCVANLKWTTASEQNSKHFEVQHSTDGKKYVQLTNIPSSGNSNVVKHYNYSSRLISKHNYFRLRMVDLDGSSKLSAVVSVTSNCNNTSISVYPNPVNKVVTVSGLQGANQVKLLDQLGKMITNIKTSNSSETLNMSSLPKGIYLIQVLQNNMVIENIKVIKSQ